MAKTSVSDDCIDMVTPWNEYLSAKYKRSFAYHTVRNRLPVTVTQVIDHLSRSKEDIVKTYGEQSREEIKDIIGYLSKLKNEMQTNKPLTPFNACERDVAKWNDFLQNSEVDMGRNLYWFSDVWLHIECYLYRRIREGFAVTKHLKTYDPFRHQKEDAFTGSLQAFSIVADHLLKECQTECITHRMKTVNQFLKLSLWGNRCDLSISGGQDVSQTGNPLESLAELDELILVNDLDIIPNTFTNHVPGGRVVDIICDNVGYEVFTDLCLAYLLVKFDLTDKVRFHVKEIPWFVSDVTIPDFNWLLSQMADLSSFPGLQELSSKWKECLDTGRWTITAGTFWTLPYSFDCMKEIDSELYDTFRESMLMVFKGDLNYRKLVGDVNWPHTEKFSTALRGFYPAPIASLRTIKSDVMVGMKPGQAEWVSQKDQDWLITGKYAAVTCFNHVPAMP